LETDGQAQWLLRVGSLQKVRTLEQWHDIAIEREALVCIRVNQHTHTYEAGSDEEQSDNYKYNVASHIIFLQGSHKGYFIVTSPIENKRDER